MDGGHFLVAGAQRSGTTLLYHVLDRHPAIEMARPVWPEPKYFLRDEPGGLTAYRRRCFAGRPGARLFGEKGTSYMERSDAASRALAILPSLKVVFVLRDPVERALSNYRFSVANGVETATLDEALRQEARRRETYDRRRFSVSPFAYLARGHYHSYLAPWEALVGRAGMRLLLFEDLIRRPAALRELFGWLGADPAIEPVMPPEPVNATAPSPIDAGLRQELREHFRESNRRLEERYGLDLSAWQ